MEDFIQKHTPPPMQQLAYVCGVFDET